MRRYKWHVAGLFTMVVLLLALGLFSMGGANAQAPQNLPTSSQGQTNNGRTDRAGAPQTTSGSHANTFAQPHKVQAPLVTLYDQYDNQANFDVTSQDFEASLDAYDSYAADDFVVPAGQTWNVSEVDVDGEYSTGGGPAASFNVYFYANSGTLPSGAPVFTGLGQAFTGSAGDAVITLSPAAVLPAGTYWVSVQSRQDFTPSGQWFWQNRTVQSNNPAAWQNPGGGFAVGCTSWGVKTTCLTTQVGPDQVFRLVGTIGGGTPPPTLTSTPTATAGSATATPCAVVFNGSLDPSDPTQTGRLTRDGTASACGTQDPCPGVFDPTGARAYDEYSIPNNSGSSTCVTVSIDTACTGTNYVFVVAYLDSFDPNNLCGSYLGDSGSSPDPNISFGVDVPSGHTLIVVVHEVTPGAGCTGYTLTVEGLPCATPVVTETPTSTASPSSTSTATAQPTNTATITLTVTSTSTPCTINFTDVHTTDYFYEDVRCVYCLGAVSGYADGTFRPFNNTTRGQMTKIIVLALHIPIATPSGTPTFNDVPAGSTFYDYIETAAGAGIVSGYADGSFRPNANVTRGQLSKIDVVAANHVYSWTILNPATPTFSDVAPGSAFYTYIETAVCHGIISGYADGTFRPGNNAIRAQIAKIVCRTSQNPPDNCNVTPAVK